VACALDGLPLKWTPLWVSTLRSQGLSWRDISEEVECRRTCPICANEAMRAEIEKGPASRAYLQMMLGLSFAKSRQALCCFALRAASPRLSWLFGSDVVCVAVWTRTLSCC
jgi:hypothetical protein